MDSSSSVHVSKMITNFCIFSGTWKNEPVELSAISFDGQFLDENFISRNSRNCSWQNHWEVGLAGRVIFEEIAIDIYRIITD